MWIHSTEMLSHSHFISAEKTVYQYIVWSESGDPNMDRISK